MAEPTWRCGHLRSPENSVVVGCLKACLICKPNYGRGVVTADELAAMEARRAAGLTIREIALVHGRDITTVYRHVGPSARQISESKERKEQRCEQMTAATVRAANLAFGLPVGRIWADTRKSEVARARMAVFLAVREQGASYKAIARAFGMDRTTVHAGVKKAAIYAEFCPEYREALAAVRAAARSAA